MRLKSIIDAENVTYAYTPAEGELAIDVLKGIDLHIEAGTFVAVLGHNGSGKSTLAKHFNGILLPTGGKVYVSGMDTADEDTIIDVRRTVGMVFQNPDNQIVSNVVEEDVAFAPENLGKYGAVLMRR
jgi:energy-coupling factor transport system ATP-binding protein